MGKEYGKTAIIIFLIILALGIYIRFSNFAEESYWNDDMTTIPTALLWFYPHSYYPGLAGQGEPALGNYLIGFGCTLSNEDFSKVTQIQPMFYPGRPALIGKEMVKAESYCHMPMYIFGILFLIVISILALMMLDKYSALYAISFYAFSSFTLQLSRWIHVDMIAYFFASLGLIFLWKFYSKELGSGHGNIFLVLSSFFFSLALSTKLPAGIFVIFFAFIVLKKYKIQSLSLLKIILKKLNLKISEKIPYDEKPNILLKAVFYSIISYIIAILISFEFSLKNLFLVIQKYGSINPEHSFISINRQLFLDIYDFMITLNSIDTLIFIFSLYIIIRLIFAKRDKNEEFLLYLFGLFTITLLLFPAMNYTRVLYFFSPAIIFIMALAFSEKQYSIFTLLRINNRKIIFMVFILVYITFSFYTSFSSSPQFNPKNQLLCLFDGPECTIEKLKNFNNPYGMASKQISSQLSSIMQENETFLSSSEMFYYYIRQEDSYELYTFINNVRNQIGRRPNLDEFIKYFKPKNRELRYIVVNPRIKDADFPEFEQYKANYIPNYVVIAYKQDAAYIYDIKNLKQR
ncbi:hypothetical protein J4231_00895 [Candidatus Woesearchaeota archaeon]|nr:hypothetical protein [Candidatus Woesearchaeota archaeon]